MDPLVDKVCSAFAARDEEGLAEALQELQHWLINLAYSIGPAKALLAVGQSSHRVISILNHVHAQSESSLAAKLAFRAGWVSATLDYFESIADRDAVDSTNAEFASTQDSDQLGYRVRMAILNLCFTTQGTRSTELTDATARFTKATKAVIKYHISQLVESGLLKRVGVSRKAVYYLVTRLGEAVVRRRLLPYELALLYIDLAASDEKMRAAIQDEIRHAWPTNG